MQLAKIQLYKAIEERLKNERTLTSKEIARRYRMATLELEKAIGKINKIILE